MHRNLVLSAQTLPPVPFDVRVAAAAAGGFRGISLRAPDYLQALEDGFDDARQQALLAEAGIEVTEIGFATSWLPGARQQAGVCEEERVLWHMARLFEPRQLNAGLWDAYPLDVSVPAFGVLCDRAGAQGLVVAVEFIPYSGLRDLKSAWALVEQSGRANAGLILDTWHMHRLGISIDEVVAIPPLRWLTVQLADAAVQPWDDVREESRHARRLPGDGCIDMTTLLQSLFESGARPLMAVEVLDDALHRLAPNAAAAKAGQSGAATLQAAGLQPPWWKPIPQEMSSTAPNPGTSGDIP